MKHIWEETDIKPVDPAGKSFLGCIVEDTRTTASNRYSILGYRYADTQKLGVTSPQLYTLTSLDDGLQTFSGTLGGIVDHLNRGYAPVIKPMYIRFKE